MSKARALAVCGGILAPVAILAAARGDLGVAAPLFFVAMVFAVRANRAWTNAKA